MKELTIEQKAKRYDEVIEKLRNFYRDYDTVSCLIDVKEELANIFTELKESEDEKTRKELIEQVAYIVPNDDEVDNEGNVLPTYQKRIDKYRAWLEKQGEKTSDKIVEKVRTEKQRVLLTETDGSANIDWDCRSLDDVKALLKCGLEFIRTIEANKQILTDSRFGGCSFRVPTRYDKGIKQGEQKPAIFIPKFRVGDKLVSTKNPSLTYEVLEVGHINELGNPEYKVEIFTDGKVKNPRNIHYMECYKVDEWAKLIEQKSVWIEEDENKITYLDDLVGYQSCMSNDEKKDFHRWLKSLKYRVQPKQEWSEEDELSFKQAIYVCHQNGYTAVENWLKSLRPQNTWKPTKEQMKALYDLNLTGGISYAGQGQVLIELYNDLKKL